LPARQPVHKELSAHLACLLCMSATMSCTALPHCSPQGQPCSWLYSLTCSVACTVHTNQAIKLCNIVQVRYARCCICHDLPTAPTASCRPRSWLHSLPRSVACTAEVRQMRRSHGQGEGPGPVAVLALGRQRAEVVQEALVARSQVGTLSALQIGCTVHTLCL
jgi:hypothetical protein